MRTPNLVENPQSGQPQLEYRSGVWIRVRQAVAQVLAPDEKTQRKGPLYGIRHLLAGQQFNGFYTSDSMAEGLPEGGVLVPARTVRERLEQLGAAQQVLEFFDRRVAEVPYLYLRPGEYQEITDQ